MLIISIILWKFDLIFILSNQISLETGTSCHEQESQNKIKNDRLLLCIKKKCVLL